MLDTVDYVKAILLLFCVIKDGALIGRGNSNWAGTMSLRPLSRKIDAETPTGGTSRGMTAGALLNLIAHTHDISLGELLAVSQVAPTKLLNLLEELRDANLVRIDGLDNLKDLYALFEQIEGVQPEKGADIRAAEEVPYFKPRRELIKRLSAERPSARVKISSKGFERALAM